MGRAAVVAIRIGACVLLMLVTTAIAWPMSETVLDHAFEVLAGAWRGAGLSAEPELSVRSPWDLVKGRLMLAWLLALPVAMPVCVHQLWRAAAPADGQRRAFSAAAVATAAAVGAGAGTLALFTRPIVGWMFTPLTEGPGEPLLPIVMVDDYAGFIVRLALAPALVASVSACLVLAAWWGTLTRASLKRWRLPAVCVALGLAWLLKIGGLASALAVFVLLAGAYGLAYAVADREPA